MSGRGDSVVPYNWHPAVHSRHFDETLAFVMIRLHEPLHRPVADQIGDVLQAADIKHACAYPLFGPWDALVRAWLTEPSYLRFLQVLQDSVDHRSSHNIDEYRGFTASEIRYFWHGTNVDLLAPTRKIKTAITSNTAAIEEVAGNPDSPDLAVWGLLKEEGLLFPRPAMPEGGVKFYTCLERTSDKMAPRQEVEAIMEAMAASPIESSRIPMIERSSLYCGSGPLADYMVRSVADDFDDVLALAVSFDQHLAKTGLRPMTLLVANPGAVSESDHVNDRGHFSPTDRSTCELLDLEEETFGEIADRQELNALVVQACELAEKDEELRRLQLQILRASALDDQGQFQSSLSYLLNFEAVFKQRLIREFSEVFGADWLQTIRNMCASSKAYKEHADTEMAKNLSEWTLGTFLVTARATVKLHPPFRGWLATQLGDDWDAAAEDLIKLRNDLAHGRVYEMTSLDSYEPDRVAYLQRTMKATVFWWRTRNSLENGKGRAPSG
jgi:hypothetical protein